MRYAVGFWLLATSAIGDVAAAWAHPAARPLTFLEVMQRSREAPAVREVDAALSVKRAADRKLGTLTHNPQISVEAGYRNDTGGRGAVVQVAVQQGLNLAGYAAARSRSTEHEAAALAIEVRAALLRQRLGAARLWTELWGIAQAEKLAREEVELARQALLRTERLFQGGAATKVDVATAQTYLAEVEARRLAVAGEAVEQGLSLGRWLGLAEGVSAQGEPDAVPLPPLTDSLVAEALRRSAQLPEPALRRAAAQVERVREKEVTAQRGAQLWLGAMALHEPTAPWAAFGTLTLSLPVFDRGQRERAELLAAAARLHVGAEAAEVGAQVELRQVLHDVEHFEELGKLLDETLLPASAREVALRERLLAAGDGTILEVLLARRSLVAARAQAVRIRASLAGSRHRLSLYLTALGLAAEEAQP